MSEAPITQISPEERADLEREAGYPFLSDRHALEYRLRRIQRLAVENMLKRPGVFDRRRVERD